MKHRTTIVVATVSLAVILMAFVAALAAGGAIQPRIMRSISDPFKNVDFSELEVANHYMARDGVPLAYRRYSPIAGLLSRGSVVLVHGSSANSRSMHPLAQSFAQAGFTAYALDIRGHGASGQRGDIAYIGQLDDDLEDFMSIVKPTGPKTLIGFSSGGGFALRVAGSSRQAMFDNYLFMAPYIDHRAPTCRPNAGGWASVGVPRSVALTLLNRIGITLFNHLPVVAFAINEASRANLTPSYSYTLATNFRPEEDYQHNIREIRKPAAVLVGQNDEAFVAAKFAQVFTDAGRPDIPVTLVPDTGHIMLTLSSVARAATVQAVEKLNDANEERLHL